MTSNLADGPYLDLKSAAKRDPSGRDGRAPSISALTRRILKGVKLRDGSRLRLTAIRTSSGWRTTEAWMREFEATLTADRLGTDDRDGTTSGRTMATSNPVPLRRRTARERMAAAERAGAALAAMGA